jgi:hypothetical protein
MPGSHFYDLCCWRGAPLTERAQTAQQALPLRGPGSGPPAGINWTNAEVFHCGAIP